MKFAQPCASSQDISLIAACGASIDSALVNDQGLRCGEQGISLPGRQLAAAFIRKAPRHLADDYQRFLFEESEAPAIVVRFRKDKPASSAHRIQCWAPKTDWRVSKTELIRILLQDRNEITVNEVLSDLRGDDAPMIWKRYFWATPRDWRLLDRLSLMPRLRTMLRRGDDGSAARWMIAQGFEERVVGGAEETKSLELQTRRVFEAKETDLNLFLLEDDCGELPSKTVTIRTRSNTKTKVYEPPHVLIAKSVNQSAFSDFAVAFRHATRGIHGGKADHDLLIFLAACIHSSESPRCEMGHKTAKRLPTLTRQGHTPSCSDTSNRTHD